jgi:hypothetical protein
MRSCYYGGTGYICDCPQPYTGKRCETNLNGISEKEFAILLKSVFVGASSCSANPFYCKNGAT